MKSITMFGLSMLVALVGVAFVGASSAMAEATALCQDDAEPGGVCPSGRVFTHLHYATLSGAKSKLLSSVINVECDTLFLGDATTAFGLSSPLLLRGKFAHTNCSNGCEITEESEDSLLSILRLAHELADWTFYYESRVHCGFFINCVYDGENLTGHALGPLLSGVKNGAIIVSEQVLHKVSGFCPETAKLDITTVPLTPTYIAK